MPSMQLSTWSNVMRSSIKPSALLMSSTISNAVKGFSLAKTRASIWGIIELKFNLHKFKDEQIIGSKICLQTTLWPQEIFIILNHGTTVLIRVVFTVFKSPMQIKKVAFYSDVSRSIILTFAIHTTRPLYNWLHRIEDICSICR